jgi:UDP-N-acetyl-D-mannosaminuronic acid dehydrogenase
MRRISVVGLGYIGLPTAILAAKSGFEVFGFDTNHEKITKINAGQPTIKEPGMAEQLKNVLNNGTFKAFKDLQYANCFVITVPTPIKENKLADLSFVFSACELVGKRLMPGNLVILESTVPVGTTENVAKLLEDHSGLKMGTDFFVAHCPERVIPGKIFKELVDNNRVIGGMCQKACELSKKFYSKFVKGFLHITDDKTAEMVKLAENSYRDVQIAFANQIASISNQIGINPFQVIEFANKHPRVKILSPGTGVGGHCVAVDPYFLIEGFPEETSLLQSARQINNVKPYQILDKILSRIQRLKIHGIAKPKICLLGITFKPNVEDIRESPALKIALELNRQKDEFDLYTFDPNISADTMQKLGLTTKNNLQYQIQNSDLVAILVKHKEFEILPESLFDNKIVIDPCGLIYDMHVKKSKEILKGSIQLKQLVKQQLGI